MSWEDILKVKLTKEGLIDYLAEFDFDHDDAIFTQEDVDLMHLVTNNPEYTVNQLTKDKLNEFLRGNYYDNFWDEFYRDLMGIDYTKMPKPPTEREMFPERSRQLDFA